MASMPDPPPDPSTAPPPAPPAPPAGAGGPAWAPGSPPPAPPAAAPAPPAPPAPPPGPTADPSGAAPAAPTMPSGPTGSGSADDDVRAPILALRDEVGKVVVGQEGTLSGLVAALLVNGHILLEGVPGTAKTLLVKSVAAALDLDFKRLQFTPDLMPSDVIGQVIFEPKEGTFRFREGPVFTNLLLADEINRTPAKTQAALLESMEERQVSVEGDTLKLPSPFVVVATQNPVEYEGTYPLPEAQLDRFLFKLQVTYPSFEQEQEMLARHDAGLDPHDVAGAGVRPVASAADLAAARQRIGALRVDPSVLGYLTALVRATRESPSVTLGVSPRGAAALLHAAKAWAWLAGRDFVTPDEVKAVAKPTMRHRLQLRPELELEGATADGVLDTVLATVPVPR